MSDRSAPSPSPAPASAPARPAWWTNEDWLALVAAVPLMAAVVLGWKVPN